MLDPLLYLISALFLAALFAAAGVHKLQNMQRFRGILADYRLLPGFLVSPAARFLPLLEVTLAGGWLLSPLLTSISASLSVASVTLLSVYAGAMGINLARGRTHIDCGCGFGGSSRSQGGESLSGWLLLRNALLVVPALIGLAETTARPLAALDFFTLVVAILALLLLYGAGNQLINTQQTMASWRKSGPGVP